MKISILKDLSNNYSLLVGLQPELPVGVRSLVSVLHEIYKYCIPVISWYVSMSLLLPPTVFLPLYRQCNLLVGENVLLLTAGLYKLTCQNECVNIGCT